MSGSLSRYNGLYSLRSFQQLQNIPANYEDAKAVQHLCTYISQQKKAALELTFKNGKISEFVEGRLYFTEEYQYRVYALPISPSRDLEGTVFWGKDEITCSLDFPGDQLEFYIHAIPPPEISTTEDFLVYKCLFERYVPEKKKTVFSQQATVPKGKYPIDQRLVGHWRLADRYNSGGFSSYSETNMYLAADGSFSRTRRSYTTSTFSDQYGNWSGMGNTDSGKSPAEYGTWGVVEGKFYLFLNGQTYYAIPYEVHSDSLFFQLQNKNELWKRA